jgi:hypothetical protein
LASGIYEALLLLSQKLGVNDYPSVTFYRHARKYFTIFEDEQLQDVQHCMALLAFPTNTGISFSQ